MSNPEREDGGRPTLLASLAACVDRAIPPGETSVRQGPVWVQRSDRPTPPVAALYPPMLCVVAQGAKELLVGDERLVYDPGRYLLNSVAVPASGRVIEASPERPGLWAMVELDPRLVAQVVLDSGTPPRDEPPLRAMGATRIDAPTLDAVLRLVRLLDTPADAAFLAPLLLKEIVYRLLTGEQAPRVRQIAAGGGRSQVVLKAVERIRREFDRPISIDALAEECGLSASALHRQFKSVTAMSPLRYQKQIRLQEARRLMVVEDLDAATAGYRVGYDDPSYFSREYRRMFGEPPRRHSARVRGGGASALLETP